MVKILVEMAARFGTRAVGCHAPRVVNPGFETGSAAPWAATAGVVQHSTTAEPSHSGNYEARFGDSAGGATNFVIDDTALNVS